MHSNSKHPAGSVTCTKKITEPWNDQPRSQSRFPGLGRAPPWPQARETADPLTFLRVVSELTVSKVQNKGGEKGKKQINMSKTF